MPSGGAVMPALPPGFRFHPTDEELIVHYLTRQAASMPCPVPIIAEVNIYKCNPWDLPGKAVFGEKEWYFFSPRDRKYPNGARPNRAAGSGYWKATGTDKAIVASYSTTPTSHHIGVKKALVFYRGKPPKGSKTDWIMHEYRLTSAATAKRRGSSMRLDDWVLCRIHKKFSSGDLQQEQEEGSTVEEDSHTATNTNTAASSPPPKSEALDGGGGGGDDEQLQQLRPMAIARACSLSDLLNTVDYAALSQLLLDGGGGASSSDQPLLESPLVYAPPAPWQTLNHNNYYNDQMPQLAETQHGYGNGNNNNNYNGMTKRKRPSLEDGGEMERLPQLLPSDHHSRSSSSSSSYCDQQLAADHESTGSLQYSGMLIHPYMNQHHHLHM